MERLKNNWHLPSQISNYFLTRFVPKEGMIEKMELKGKVKSGFGNASFWVDKINNVFENKYHMKLFLGTLNVKLANDYILEDEEKITANEYGGNFDVLIKECEILGHKGYIVRTEKNNKIGGDHPLTIIEIVSDINIRKANNLNDNDNIILHI